MPVAVLDAHIGRTFGDRSTIEQHVNNAAMPKDEATNVDNKQDDEQTDNKENYDQPSWHRRAVHYFI